MDVKPNYMLVETAAKNTLTLLADTLTQIDNAYYTTHYKELNGSSVGQHYRHIVEMFECLRHGYNSGTVSYDNRKRNLELEEDKAAAARFISEIVNQISLPEKPLQLAAGYSINSESVEYFSTTYHRELAYTLEHAVHHMAIIKIGLRFIAPQLELHPHFGVAASTIRHNRVGSQ